MHTSLLGMQCDIYEVRWFFFGISVLFLIVGTLI